MQTLRLRDLIFPANIERLLDSYVRTSMKVPQSASKVEDLVQIPLQLRDAAIRATTEGWVWTAWCDEYDAWLFAATLSLDRARELGRPVLEIRCHDVHEPRRSHIIASRLPDGSWYECSE